jgi:hypothetical protein
LSESGLPTAPQPQTPKNAVQAKFAGCPFYEVG